MSLSAFILRRRVSAVSKDRPERTAASFETPAAQAPQDEEVGETDVKTLIPGTSLGMTVEHVIPGRSAAEGKGIHSHAQRYGSPSLTDARRG